MLMLDLLAFSILIIQWINLSFPSSLYPLPCLFLEKPTLLIWSKALLIDALQKLSLNLTILVISLLLGSWDLKFEKADLKFF